MRQVFHRAIMVPAKFEACLDRSKAEIWILVVGWAELLIKQADLVVYLGFYQHSAAADISELLFWANAAMKGII